MYTRHRFSITQVLLWTRLELFGFIFFVCGIITLHNYLDLKFIALPWTPIALIGTAVAFMVGFQNNAAYDRIWEARKIWGGVVNASRTWGMKTKDMVNNQHAKDPLSAPDLKEVHKTLVYRHIAWMTAFRHAMRQNKKWEVLNRHFTNKEWSNKIFIPEAQCSIKEDLEPYLNQEELYYILEKNNRAAALLYLQSKHIRELKDQGYIWEYAFIDLERLLEEFFTLQGKSERIKNFPYPRQFATMSNLFTRLFLVLLPFGLIPEFEQIGRNVGDPGSLAQTCMVWMSVPFCTVVFWVFHMMERVGRAGENPFEGGINDVME